MRSPECGAADAIGDLQQVMVVVPVEGDEDEAEQIDRKLRDQRPKVVQAAAVRWVQVEHHDRDRDRDHCIAERLEAAAAHQWPALSGVARVARRTRLLTVDWLQHVYAVPARRYPPSTQSTTRRPYSSAACSQAKCPASRA